MTQLFRYRDLIVALVARELKVRYRRSAIGFLWTMLQPLLMMLVLHTVFSSIFRFKMELGNYPVYALAGILFWNFFSQSILSSMN
ncbi:MAG TPA: ABC transporter permease, partial [Thermoanaerobaculia bacterium]|nr:ABC transporter permease [Thermoanaerobaculia bacterium]